MLAFCGRPALVAVVFFGLTTLVLAASPQAQKPASNLMPAPKSQVPLSESDALATKSCPRGVAEEWDNCNGVSEFQNGDRYIGKFSKGLPDGIGTYYWRNGREYFGEFKRGLPNGKGKFTDMSNSVYIGDFVDGRMSGKATVDYQNGAKYVGEYKDDRKNGKGTYTYANGDKFTGDFADDDMTPNGVLELANGDKYSGAFKSLKPQGKGAYTFKDGRKFTGDFAAGEPQGQGTLVAADGTVLATGLFNGWDSVANPDQRKPADMAVAAAPAPAAQDQNKVITVTPAPVTPADPAQGAATEPPQAKPVEKPQQAPVPAAPAAPAPKAEKPKIAAAPPVAIASDVASPVHCRFNAGFWMDTIQCDVVEETAEIKDISFNRGKCPSASDGLKQLQAMQERDGANLTLVFRAFFVKAEDFRGLRKFGDRIEIPVVNCPNLLEFTVEANETSKTWKTY